MATPTRKVHVKLFAVLREQAGCSAVSFDTAAATPAALYAELQQRHPLTLPPSILRVSVNETYVAMDAALQDQDRVVFIPPVAGG